MNYKSKRAQESAKIKGNAAQLVKIVEEKKIEAKDTIEKAQIRAEKGIIKEDVQYIIIDKYLKGASIPSLAEEYHYPQRKISDLILDHHKLLTNVRATNALMDTKPNSMIMFENRLKTIEVVNDEFLALLSPENSETLTEEEALYCWVYVNRGDTREALEMSGLQVGLYKEVEATYKRGLMARSLFLQQKSNVAQYIKTLREERFKVNDVNKGYVQELLLEQIDQVKQRGSQSDLRNISKLIELLGKTIGAFTEKIEISEVDPSKSLDLLISMAKEATVKELS